MYIILCGVRRWVWNGSSQVDRSLYSCSFHWGLLYPFLCLLVLMYFVLHGGVWRYIPVMLVYVLYRYHTPAVVWVAYKISSKFGWYSCV